MVHHTSVGLVGRAIDLHMDKIFWALNQHNTSISQAVDVPVGWKVNQ
jgi:hypothetical protein